MIFERIRVQARMAGNLVPLSEDARRSRRPQNPADLVEALQDPVLREVGRSRPARAARACKNQVYVREGDRK